MNKDMDAAGKLARQELVHTVTATDKKIVAIYQQAADDLAREAGNAKAGSLTERWKTDMEESLRERIRQLNGELDTVIRGAAGSAAGLPVEAQASWLDTVLGRTGHSARAGGAFRSVLTRTPDEALKQVVTGQAYLDGKSLSKRIWSATGRLQGGIQDVIAQGIAQKKSAYQLAKDLEAYVNPKAREPMDWLKVYPDISFPVHIDYNAQRLARSSINQAYAIANREAALLNPFVDCIHWALSPSHYERQVLPFGADICDEYATHNEGLGIGNWPVKLVPLPHAMCLCYQYAVVEKTTEACAKELRAWLDGEPNERLEGAFNQWRQDLQAQTGRDIMDALDYTASERREGQLEAIAGQDWYQDMTLRDKQAFDNVFIDASDEELAFWARHGGLIKGSFYEQGRGAYYAPWEKAIHMNMDAVGSESREIGQTRNVLTFFHEAGHLFDHQAFAGQRLRDALGAFDEALTADYLAYANRVLEANGEKPLGSLARLSTMQKALLNSDLYEQANNKSSISDIVGGLTNNRISNGWQHSTDYWQSHSPSTEAIAEMFEAKMMKGERLEAMKSYFPNAYQQFEDTLRKLEEEAT